MAVPAKTTAMGYRDGCWIGETAAVEAGTTQSSQCGDF
jgi:hypothetical protein